MSDQQQDDFPGFIEDDEPKRKPVPPPAESAAGGFDPFADVDVKPPDPANADADDAPLDPGRAEPAAQPDANSPAAPFDPFAGQQIESPDPDQGAMPGGPPASADRPQSRKDLWSCEHCGAKNKPDRDTCRSCGKSPLEKVVPPLHKRPAVQGIAAVVVFLLAVILYLMTRTTADLVPPTVGNIDDAPRIVDGVSMTHDLEEDGITFHGEAEFAVCGRVVQTLSTDKPGADQEVVLALAKTGRDDSQFENATYVPGKGVINKNLNNSLPHAVLILIYRDGEPPSLERGAYLSLSGHSGSIKGENISFVPKNDHHIVLVNQWQSSP